MGIQPTHNYCKHCGHYEVDVLAKLIHLRTAHGIIWNTKRKMPEYQFIEYHFHIRPLEALAA